jgi:hypothetical protein
MKTSVRPVLYDRDEQELTGVLQMNLPYRQHADYFRWLYRENPAGEALAWIATDAATDRIVGAAAAFPRMVLCGGTEARCYVLGDFCIQPQYRSLGLAIVLQKTCLDGLYARNAEFALDFPSHSMLAIYDRLHIPVNETLVRHVRPLRADRQIERIMPVPVIARGFAAAVNACLRFRDEAVSHSDDWSIATEEGPWGGDFTAAAVKWSRAGAITVTRTADYLNWRYCKHPEHTYRMVSARQGRCLGGYVVFHRNGDVCVIDDLVAEDRLAYRGLLLKTAAITRGEGIQTLSTPWPSRDPQAQLLRTFGFRPRETSPAVLLSFDRSTGAPAKELESCCYLSHGDWEV